MRNTVTGLVVVVHGGRSQSREPTSPVQPAVVRMIPLAAAVRRAAGPAVKVIRPRLRLRGWNGAEASPVADLTAILDGLPDLPLVLIGHSMGARAALRVAADPRVTGVAGLAPWTPPGEPVDQLTGRRVLLVHGTADTVTSPADTLAYAARARRLTEVATISLTGADHAMLRRAALWHRLAADFALSCLTTPPPSIARAFDHEHTTL
ncbi:alpha/beta hydrolase [Actinocorallia longicatena]|uniref:Alpha/beta hydrolase n=1 Tax=Actinocorallia longicatena TaxID=111803 RepID=A0ABP6QGX8_9ACTN